MREASVTGSRQSSPPPHVRTRVCRRVLFDGHDDVAAETADRSDHDGTVRKNGLRLEPFSALLGADPEPSFPIQMNCTHVLLLRLFGFQDRFDNGCTGRSRDPERSIRRRNAYPDQTGTVLRDAINAVVAQAGWMRDRLSS